MKLDSVFQVTEDDEVDIKYTTSTDDKRVMLTIGPIAILTDNPTFLSDLADVAWQAEIVLRRVQAHAREIADDMDAEDKARARAYDAVLTAEERWDA